MKPFMTAAARLIFRRGAKAKRSRGVETRERDHKTPLILLERKGSFQKPAAVLDWLLID
jgi:hypothetical protein